MLCIIRVGLKMNRKKQRILLLSLISIIIAPSLVSGAEYYSFNVGDSYYWTIKVEGTISLILDPDNSVNKDLYLKAQIFECDRLGTPSYVSNIRIKPSFVGSSVTFDDYWNSVHLYTSFIQKRFYLFGLLFIPLEYSSSQSYINYLDSNGFDVTTTSSSSILTYTSSTGATHTLKYDNKGILDSYVKNYDHNQISVKRALSVGGIIGLGIGGLVIIIGLIALTVILVRRKRRASASFDLSEKPKSKPVYRFQEPNYTGISSPSQGAPKQTLRDSSEKTLGLPFAKYQLNRQFYAEASFGIIILLFILINDTIISQSFYLHLTEITYSYQIWNGIEINFLYRLFVETSIFTIILCAITFILALISPLDLDKNLSQEELAKNILVKICFLVTSIFSLISFIVQRSTANTLIEGLYEDFELVMLKNKTAYTFEVLAVITLLVILCIMPLIYKNSDLFSFYKPAFYVMSLGLIFFIIAGFIASSFYEKMVLDLFLTEETALSQYRTGAIFTEIAYFMIMLSMMIWVISLARKRGGVIIIGAILITFLTALFEFLDSYLLLQYNLSEIYFEIVLFEDVLQRHQAFSSIASILFISLIFLGIVLRLQLSSDSQTTISSDIARRRFTPEERMKIASSQAYKRAQVQTGERAQVRHEYQGEILEPIRISLCPLCKEIIEEDSQFCRYCGARLSNTPDRRKRS